MKKQIFFILLGLVCLINFSPLEAQHAVAYSKADSITQLTNNTSEVILLPDTQVEFPGGANAMMSFLMKNLNTLQKQKKMVFKGKLSSTLL